MRFKVGDRVRVNPSHEVIVAMNRANVTGKGYLPGRICGEPTDFSTIGVITSVSPPNNVHDEDIAGVRWDNPRWGQWYYNTQYLVQAFRAGF